MDIDNFSLLAGAAEREIPYTFNDSMNCTI